MEGVVPSVGGFSADGVNATVNPQIVAAEHLNLKPKQKLTVIEKDKMVILVPQISLDDLRGIAPGINTDNYREKRTVSYDYC